MFLLHLLAKCLANNKMLLLILFVFVKKRRMQKSKERKFTHVQRGMRRYLTPPTCIIYTKCRSYFHNITATHVKTTINDYILTHILSASVLLTPCDSHTPCILSLHPVKRLIFHIWSQKLFIRWNVYASF